MLVDELAYFFDIHYNPLPYFQIFNIFEWPITFSFYKNEIDISSILGKILNSCFRVRIPFALCRFFISLKGIES